MRFIQVWSYSCANYLTAQLKESHEKRRVYYYGFQVFIGELVKIILILLLSLLLGMLRPVGVILTVFMIVRTAAGGYHMDTQGKCLVVSLGLFLIPGAVVKYSHIYWSFGSIASFITAVAIICIIAFIKWIPADTPNRPITKLEEIRKFRIKSLIYITFFLCLACITLLNHLYVYSLSLVFGLLVEIFTVTPVAYRLFDWVSGKAVQG